MATPRRESPDRLRSGSGSISTSPLTISLPARNGSPVQLRRSDSPVDERSRLSPTLVRSFNPNDPESRERQRTLDADIARQLSRARQSSVSISSDVVSPFHSGPSAHVDHPVLAAPDLPSFTEDEEREFDAARVGGAGSAPPTVDGVGDLDGKSDFFPAGTETDGGLLEGRYERPDDPLPVPDAQDAFLPPMYQHVAPAGFEFGPMEEFASEEKRRLGLESPSETPGGLRWMDLPAARRFGASSNGAGPSRLAADGDGAGAAGADETASMAGTDNGEGPSFRRVRQRKISQSAMLPRRGGKKTALFEGTAGAPPPSLTPGVASRGVPGASAASSYENVFGHSSGPPPGGQGHDRPYRFSFYSNALSATIHARSLAELPADGQTFEQLFRGYHTGADLADASVPPSAHPSHVPSAAGTPAQASHMPHGRKVSAAQSYAPAVGRMSAADPVPGYAMPGNGALHQKGMPGGPSGDANTWWLDVLNPTDEEMKMLSKVW
jgi:magnesium transporter